MLDAENISVIDNDTNTVVDTISVGIRSISIAYNPTNNNMYVANADSDTVSVIATLSIQPPTITTITSSVDGNGNPVQMKGQPFQCL